jgi:hypothetical protein
MVMRAIYVQVQRQVVGNIKIKPKIKTLNLESSGFFIYLCFVDGMFGSQVTRLGLGPRQLAGSNPAIPT